MGPLHAAAEWRLTSASLSLFPSTWSPCETQISPRLSGCVWGRREKSEMGLSRKNMEELPEQDQTVSQGLGISVKERTQTRTPTTAFQGMLHPIPGGSCEGRIYT